MFKEVMILSFILAYIHWHAYTRHLKISKKRKFLYTLVDFIHTMVPILILILPIFSIGNIKRVILLNIFNLVLIIQFFYFHKCSLTILHNKIVGDENGHKYAGIKRRIKYLFDKEYTVSQDNSKSSYNEWFEWSIPNLIILFAVNMYTYFKMKQ